MALNTIIGSKNIPEDGVRLTKSEALEFQKKIIRKWKSLPDVVFLQYGWIFSSVVTFASASYCTNIVRSLLNMGSHFKIIPYYVTAAVPSVMSGMWTEKKVTENTLLMTTKCPMCVHLKFGIGQLFFSVAFPTVLSFVFHLPLAHYYNTTALPDIRKDSKPGYIFCYKLIKSKALQFQVVAALQIPLILFLPYLQAKQLDNINTVLIRRSTEN